MTNDPIEVYTSISFDLMVDKSNAEILKKQELAFKYLNYLNKSAIILNEQKSLDAIKFTYMNSVMFKSFDLGMLSLRYNFPKLLASLLSYLKENFMINFKSFGIVKKNKYMNALFMLSVITKSFTRFSIKFCKEFLKEDGMQILFSYLGDELIINTYLSVANNPNDQAYVMINGTMRSILRSIINLKQVKNKVCLKDLDATSILIKYSNTKHISDNRISIYIALASYCDANEINNLDEISRIVHEICKLIGSCSSSIENGEFIERVRIEIDNPSENESVYLISESKEICLVSCPNTGAEWNLGELIRAVSNLASGESSIKNEIYFRHSLNRFIRSILYHGNLVEKELALLLLKQLCVDEAIAQDIKTDDKLFNYIALLYNDENLDGDIKKHAYEILNQTSEKKSNKLELINKNQTEKRLMISYNRDSRDLCMAIKAEIEKLNYKVWIDVEDISGSSLESMALAIENAACVLMCLTEKYEKSVNCRAEAEYIFQLDKPFIPLIMQKNYKPGTWLSKLLFLFCFFYYYKIITFV
jgi:hypothetical protein